jgi:hypothetical protein
MPPFLLISFKDLLVPLIPHPFIHLPLPKKLAIPGQDLTLPVPLDRIQKIQAHHMTFNIFFQFLEHLFLKPPIIISLGLFEKFRIKMNISGCNYFIFLSASNFSLIKLRILSATPS